MKSDLNRKIEEICNKFKQDLKKAKDEKNRKVAELLENAEKEYVEKIKQDINL
jgi:vacuolar-type H+-ATPase subunit H